VIKKLYRRFVTFADERPTALFLRASGVVVTVATVGALVSCGAQGKYTEPYNDSDRGQTNSGPADVLTFPDGFNNVATKCDHGNRVYVIYHSDGAYGGVAVAPNDPSCK
jgi:hypothetical protein